MTAMLLKEKKKRNFQQTINLSKLETMGISKIIIIKIIINSNNNNNNDDNSMVGIVIP